MMTGNVVSLITQFNFIAKYPNCRYPVLNHHHHHHHGRYITVPYERYPVPDKQIPIDIQQISIDIFEVGRIELKEEIFLRHSMNKANK